LKARKSKEKFVLDTFAILTYMKEEPGWEKVRDLLCAAYKENHTIFLNCVTLGEFYYIAYREYGAVAADRAVALVKLWPIKLINIHEGIAIVAGRIKAENKLSYADAFVVATAILKKAKIVSGDREFESLVDLVDIFWLPRNR
jgi:predicted nucleic acid-binding protein